MQIVYEITATVREDLIDSFEQYMSGRHIPDVMATRAFISSALTRSGGGRYRIAYQTTRQDLDTYLREHAPRLRKHIADRFPDGVELSREEWDVIATF